MERNTLVTELSPPTFEGATVTATATGGSPERSGRRPSACHAPGFGTETAGSRNCARRRCRRYRRMTRKAEAAFTSIYRSDTNTRRVRRAPFALFRGGVSRDVVSRAWWRRVRSDRDAWCARSLAGEDIVRLILDSTVVRTRIDGRATNIPVPAAVGGRRDGPQGAAFDRKNGRREHRRVGAVPGQFRRTRPQAAGIRRHRRRRAPGPRSPRSGAGTWPSSAARSRTPQPAGPRTETPARGDR